MAKTACYCGSEKPFAECCGPIIHGTSKARTPEEVMRARFSAHCLHNYEYLVTSCHPEHRDDVSVEEIANWAQHITWTNLEVLSATPGETPDKGHVSFVAHYTVRDIPQELKEDAVFQKHDGAWYYVDGVVQGEEPFVRDFPRIGRNDPCPCNSGKKYKKCCGK